MNGDAGNEPEPYLELREAVRRFPSEEAIAALRRRDVRFDGDTVSELVR